MKKVVLFFGIAAAVALASCTPKAPATVVDPAEEIEVVDPIIDEEDAEDVEIIIVEEEGAE